MTEGGRVVTLAFHASRPMAAHVLLDYTRFPRLYGRKEMRISQRAARVCAEGRSFYQLF